MNRIKIKLKLLRNICSCCKTRTRTRWRKNTWTGNSRHSKVYDPNKYCMYQPPVTEFDNLHIPKFWLFFPVYLKLYTIFFIAETFDSLVFFLKSLSLKYLFTSFNIRIRKTRNNRTLIETFPVKEGISNICNIYTCGFLPKQTHPAPKQERKGERNSVVIAIIHNNNGRELFFG